MDLRDEAAAIREAAGKEILSCKSLDDVEAARVRYLGRKGAITRLLRELGRVAPEERKEAGKLRNQTKAEILSQIETRRNELKRLAYSSDLARETIDVTLPGRRRQVGRLHPTLRVMDEIVQVFVGMGFSSVVGPEIETEYNNFDALNFPA